MSGVSADQSAGPVAAGSPVFATTHWSVVLTAGQLGAPRATEALETLCRTYWYPLYAYARRCGHEVADAQDLTQEFFARLLEKNYLQSVDPAKGRFRSFLLASMRNFLNNEWAKVQTVKRGGRCTFVSWEQANAEGRYAPELVHQNTAERVYEQAWAFTLLERVFDNLNKEYAATGKAHLLEVLQPMLTGEKGADSYADLAARLGTTEGALKMAVLRLRRRYRELLRFEVAHTVSCPEEIDEEIRHLFEVAG